MKKNQLSFQQIASDPSSSAWVNASAGSGKTKVLTDRLLRILLNGTDPSQILCLTFTKTAANEMTERLYKSLSDWSQSGKDERQILLSNLLGRAPTPSEMKVAAQCLYTVRDNLPGIALQTFHSFCQKLLQKFPLEANLQPGFLLLDEIQQKKELEELKQDILYKNSSLSPTLETIADLMTENTFENLLNTIISHKNSFSTLFNSYKNFKKCLLDHEKFILGNHYSANNITTVQEIHKNLYKKSSLSINSFLQDINTLIPSTMTEKSFWEKLKNLKEISPEQQWTEVKKCFFTKENKIKSRLLSKKTLKQYPYLEEKINALTFSLEKQLEEEKCLTSSLSTKCVLQLAYQFLKIYNKRKQERNIMDFDDIIIKVKDLLRSDVYGPLVLHRESQEISHILMDEAQDTSPIQWEIIHLISQEFLNAGMEKTFFAVGDAKQSIYSFQGANYELFKKMQTTFQQLHENIGLPWNNISLDTSYRSTPFVLKTVDNIFNAIPAPYSLDNRISHTAFRQDHKGNVHIEPIITRPSSDQLKESFLETPLEYTQKELAATIAKHISHWCEEEPILPSTGKPLQPCDIMILLRKRSSLIKYLTHELKEYNIPVNGEDRINLWQHLAIQDLFYIGKWLIEPYDDFALTVILKSPLIRLPEEDIFYLCSKRGENTLWEFLEQNKEKYPKVAHLLNLLDDKAKTLKPYDLYIYLLEKEKLKSRYRSIFGKSVDIYISLFLEQLFQKEYAPEGLSSLISFLESMEENKENSYPRPQEEKNCLQITTVHGAKGRQAPLVILPDTTDLPVIKDIFLWHSIDASNSFFIFSPTRTLLPQHLEHILAKKNESQIKEYMRLLYVALTRAEDYLFLAGTEPLKNHELSWYNLSLAHIDNKKNSFFSSPLENCTLKKVSTLEKESIKNSITHPLLSSALEKEVSNSFKPITGIKKKNILTPLKKLQTHDRFFQERGTLIHQILEKSPFTTIEDLQKEVNLLSSLFSSQNLFSPAERNKIIQEIWALQENDEILRVLSFKQYSEYTLVGLYNNHAYKGRIDRLAFDHSSKNLYVIDFKTSSNAPCSLEKIPSNHKEQLDIYTELLKKAFPKTPLKPTLIYTKNRRLFYL